MTFTLKSRNRALMEGVAANKDHNLTIISADIDKRALPNMHYIHLEKIYDVVYGPGATSVLDFANHGPIGSIMGYDAWITAHCKGIFASKGLKTILEYPDDFKFDVVVFDFTASPCLLPLLHKFKYPPLIAATPFSSPNYKSELVGGHQYPAYSK